MAGIRVRNLVKHFPPDVHAVDDITFAVSDGELLVLLGPSGCGKTTTLRCIAGLENQTSGDIFFDDQLVNDLSPADRDISFVFQFYALYPHLKTYDNLAFPLKAANVSQSEVDRRVEQVAELLRIKHLLQSKPRRLPAGEQQRIALGRAIIRRPQVFLMDEPLTNLDAALRQDMRAELKHLQQEIGTTTIYVTHDQTEAMSLGHRVAVMHRGKLEQIGTPLEVYRHPASLFVAGFIGSPPMNFLDVTLEDGPALVNSTGQFHLKISPAMARGLPPRTPLRLGIRSEDIEILPDGAQGDMSVKIYVIEPLGDETVYGLELPGDHMMLAKAPPTLDLDIGAVVGAAFDRENLHLFKVSDGKALG